jgi:hypothetical protein
MKYIKVKWIHTHSTEPVLLFSELDDDRWEQRKVEIFADGGYAYASQFVEKGDTGLGLVPVPLLSEIALDSQFEPFEITRDEFELIWTEALAGNRIKSI